MNLGYLRADAIGGKLGAGDPGAPTPPGKKGAGACPQVSAIRFCTLHTPGMGAPGIFGLNRSARMFHDPLFW